MIVADFSLSCSHIFLNSEEPLAWPVQGLQTADGWSQASPPPQQVKLLWQLPSTPNAAYAAAAGVALAAA